MEQELQTLGFRITDIKSYNVKTGTTRGIFDALFIAWSYYKNLTLTTHNGTTIKVRFDEDLVLNENYSHYWDCFKITKVEIKYPDGKSRTYKYK